MGNKYIKYQFDGMTEEIQGWDELTFTAFYKEEIRKKEADKQIAASYIHAAEIAFKTMRIENNPVVNCKLFRENNLCIPMLFLCRHAIELTIKLVVESKTEKVENGHKLQNLWNKFKTVTGIKNKKYDELINAFKELDEDGLQLRYAKDLEGNEYKKIPCFVKSDLIMKDTKSLYEYLISLL